MAEIRSVSVHLDADVASYVAKMRLAGAETDKAFGRSERGISTTNARLGETEKTLGRVSVAERRLGSDVDSTRVKVDTGAKSLDRYSGRLGIFLDLALGLGPALVPIGAVGVPAVTALGTGVLGAAAGFGVAKLAVLGVGNALKAVNKAAIDPTVENLKAAHQALNQLPPSARDFVLELQAMRPEVQRLQRIAANGLFPGAEQGLHALTRDLPIVRKDVREISGELGILARDTGRSLASDRWKPFLRFVGTEAPTQLGVMGRSVGSVSHGVAELLMGFSPLTHDVDRGILRLAQDFDRWATSLDRTRGYEDFLDYVAQNGPKVLDLLGNTATLFFDISRAAAPLGGPVLDALNTVLRVLDAVANSDLGTPLFTGLVAMRLLTRATQLWGSQGVTSARQFVTGQREAYSTILNTITAQQRATMSSKQLSEAEAKQGGAWKTVGKGALGAGLAAGGFALVASGLTDKLHLTNTATLAMAGSLAGPWGAAVGAGVGLVLDFAGGQRQALLNTAQLADTLDRQTGAITKNTRAYVDKQLVDQGVLEDAKALGLNLQDVEKAALGNAAAYDRVAAAGRALGYGSQEDADKLANVKGALDSTSGSMYDARRRTLLLAEAHGRAVDSSLTLTRSQRRLAGEMEAARAAARKQATAFLTLGDDVDKSKVSLDRWIHQLQHEAQALTQFGNNARRAADKGLRDGLIKELEAAGPAGALRMRQLANATQTEIAKANRAWDSGRRATRDYADAAAYVTNHPPVLSVDGIPQSIHEIRLVQSALAALRDKTIDLTVHRVTGGSVKAGADGMTVPGPRAPYGDKVFTHLAPGEEVISNRHGQADRFRPLLKRINSMADGGTVTTSTSRVQVGPYAGSGLGAAADDAVRGLRGLKASLADSTKELDQERQHRQQLAQARQQVISTARDGFRSDFLGVTPDGIWGDAGSDPASILRGDIRNARHFRQDIRKLRRRGISAGLASQVTTLAGADQLAGMSPAELRELNRLYARRQKASQAAGVVVGNAADGAKLDAVRGEIQKTNHEVRRLTAAVKHMEHENAKNADRTGDRVGDKINGAARDARQRAR